MGVSERLGKLRFMANKAPAVNDAAVPAAATAPAAKAAPKVSSKLNGLQFMRKESSGQG